MVNTSRTFPDCDTSNSEVVSMPNVPVERTPKLEAIQGAQILYFPAEFMAFWFKFRCQHVDMDRTFGLSRSLS